ncbi:MAG: aspartyl-phosphate phosphatase Spo0E family protein [Clostridia bacterium]
MDLIREINNMRRSLHNLLSKHDNICEREIILHSQKLDRLIAQYYKQVQQGTGFQQSTH